MMVGLQLLEYLFELKDTIVQPIDRSYSSKVVTSIRLLQAFLLGMLPY